MSWRIAQRADFADLKRFIVKHEEKAVAFSSYLRRGEMLWEGNGYIILIDQQGSLVSGAVLFTPGGLVIPVLNNDDNLALPANAKAAQLILRHYPALYSVMGIRRDVLLMEELVNRGPKHCVEYYLMALARQDFNGQGAAATPAGLSVGRAQRSDLRLLFALQELYEREEVCLEPGRFSRRACLRNLKYNMIHQFIFKGVLDGSLVAKAGTNARGFRVDQIGGVFTLASHRNRGIARALTRALLTHIFQTKDTAVLFVKTANQAAISLYRKLGFQVLDNFRITYYNV